MSAPVVLTTQRQGLPDIPNGLGGLDLSRFSLDNSAEPDRSVTVFKHTTARSLSIMAGGSSGPPCPVHVQIHVIRSKRAGPCTCSLADILNGSTGHVADSHYLAQVNVPSEAFAAKKPLLVISLDGVIETHLPDHLVGGYTDYMARPYLQTIMKYLLLQQTPWCFVFYTAKPREEGLKILRQLNLPTGGPEEDERDGVLGLFAQEDMRSWSGSPHPIKDLESMWETLYDEEGIRWGVSNTVVLSDDPQEMAKQPYNFISVPKVEYKSAVRPAQDLFLLLVIAILNDLEAQTNFAYHIRERKLNDLTIWTSKSPEHVTVRNAMLYDAVCCCAQDRISIKALTGNKRDAP